MFFQGFGKRVRARAVGFCDEVDVTGLRRLERGLERRDAGIGDGTGGKARTALGIVRVSAFQVRAIDGSAVTPLKKRCINGGGIAVKLHSHS